MYNAIVCYTNYFKCVILIIDLVWLLHRPSISISSLLRLDGSLDGYIEAAVKDESLLVREKALLGLGKMISGQLRKKLVGGESPTPLGSARPVCSWRYTAIESTRCTFIFCY